MWEHECRALLKVILSTFGSFGDLHPFLALANELKRRGHRPVIATSEVYRLKVEAEGIEFSPARPDLGELLQDEEFLKQLWDPKRGTEYLLRDYVLPRVEGGYQDLLAACAGADLLVNHTISYAGPLVAEVQKLPWVSIALQPTVLFSARDPSVIAPAPWLRQFYGLGPWFFRLLLRAADRRTRGWAAPVARLRQKLGLPPGENPVMRGQFSPLGTLALFSKHFAAPQADWPVNTVATGFVSYDKRGEGFGPADDGDALARFVAKGPAPVVFTLGSSAVMSPGQFFEESRQAAVELRMRAVLLVGKTAAVPLGEQGSVFVAEYAPYSQLLPKAAATVHQGGIGTMAQALRAGKPMLMVPWAHDQPDNAERCRKLGVSRTVKRGRYRSELVVRELDRLLNDPRYAERARMIAERLAGEDGLRVACDALEKTLRVSS
jgi:UDP:flavonoid glycosyltransferase YjiC (YdhE family)